MVQKKKSAQKGEGEIPTNYNAAGVVDEVREEGGGRGGKRASISETTPTNDGKSFACVTYVRVPYWLRAPINICILKTATVR